MRMRISEVETRKTEDGDENLEYLRGAAEGRNVILIVLESTAARYLWPVRRGAGSDADVNGPESSSHRRSTAHMPSIQRASRACSPRSAPATRRSTQRRRFTLVSTARRWRKAFARTGIEPRYFTPGVSAPGNGADDRGSRIRPARGCRSDWRPGELEFRRRRAVHGPADARVDRFPEKQPAILPGVSSGGGTSPVCCARSSRAIRGHERLRQVPQLSELRRRRTSPIYRWIARAESRRTDVIRHSG